MILRAGVVGLVVGLCLTSEVSAQILFGPPPPYGYRYKSSTLVVIVNGLPPPPPQPRITINNYYGNSSPLVGSGYDQDTRGYDLDQVPVKKTPPSDSGEGKKPVTTDDAPKPLPGVDVSKSKSPVRPGDLPPPVKDVLPRPAPELPPPPEPLAEPREESARLLELGKGAFQADAYGLAAQRFRQATEVAPGQPQGYFLLAQAQVALGKFGDAVGTIQTGMKIDKQWPRIVLQPRLELYKGRDAEFGEHMKHLTDAVAAHPNQARLMFLVAHQLWFDGQRKDALAVFQRARPLADVQDRPFIDAFLAVGGPGALAKASP